MVIPDVCNEDDPCVPELEDPYYNTLFCDEHQVEEKRYAPDGEDNSITVEMRNVSKEEVPPRRTNIKKEVAFVPVQKNKKTRSK